MDSIWKILGIEQTSDLDSIKNAYRQKLVSVNPEDDPEGFKALRSAYETALQQAKTSDAEKQSDTETLTEYDIWIKKIEEIYRNFTKRIDTSCWMEVLQEDICISLDTSSEARDCLLKFLMDNFRLPYKVWRCIEECFHITDEAEELYEKFPREFIDYVIRSINTEEFLNYSLFEGDEDSDYDGFISSYFKLKSSVDEGNTENFQELYAECKDYFVYHPYTIVEEARYYTKQQEYEKALELLKPLYISHAEDNYILYYLCDVYLKLGRKEEAAGHFNLLLEREPNHYSGKLGMAGCYILNQEYEKAKEMYLDILEVYHGDNYVNEKLLEVNEFLIEKFRKDYEQDKNNIKAGLELGWCLCQNGKYKETVELLDDISPNEEHEFEYNNLKGRSLLYNEQYERALKYLPKWLKGLEAIEPDDTPENKKKRRRIGYAYYAIGCAYAELPGEDTEQNRETALGYLDNACLKETDSFERLGYKSHKANILFRLERYEQCVDVCDEIIEESAQYFPAFVRRQEAYYKLKRYQDVVDDFYRAVSIYAKEAKPYELAIKTFLQFDKYEDALGIVERAEQEEVVSTRLLYYKARILRSRKLEDADIKKAYELVNRLKDEDKVEELERKGDAWYEGALCKLELNELDEALEEIQKAILLDPSEGDYLYCKANIYYNQKKYQEAKNLYERLKEQYPDSDTLLFKLGRVYDMLEFTATALSYYLKVLELYPEHGSVNHYIAAAYEVLGDQKYKNSYYEKALPYYTKQIEVYPNDYNYIERGLLYVKLERFEDAVADYKHAIEHDPESPYPYNNMGIAYKYMKMFEEAIECFLKAVELRGDDMNMRPFLNLASCYSILKDNENAEKYYIENTRVFSEFKDAYKELGLFYRRVGEFDKAIDVYEKEKGRWQDEDEADYLVKLADTYLEKGDIKKAEALYKKAMKVNPDSADAFSSYAELCFYYKQKYRKALRMYKKAINICNDATSYDHSDYLYYMGKIYYYMGEKEKAKDAMKDVIDYYVRTYGSISQYLNSSSYKPIRNYVIGIIYYYSGDVEKAREFFEKVDCNVICRQCKHSVCYEALIAKGLLQEYEKNYTEAVRFYQEARDITNDAYCHFLISRLKKEKG
jgi:tetratricopeptide (TPR) repeat protein